MPRMPRALPPPRLSLLTQPASEPYAHFREHADAPFEPLAQGFSRANAWWLAEAALLAYWPEAHVRATVQALGFTCTWIRDQNTEGFVMTDTAVTMVAFRGTESTSPLDVLDDVRLGLEPWPAGGTVHAGFRVAAERVWAQVVARVGASPVPVFFTGHSLGAAVATLVADRISAEFPDVPFGGLYTFGSPLVGDRAFVDGFNRRHQGRSFRVVNDRDGVTRVPPPQLGYRHVNDERFLGDHDVTGLLPEALVDHTPSRYTVLAWNALVAG